MSSRWLLLCLLGGLGLAPRPAEAACGDGAPDPDEACDLGIGNEAGRTCTPQCTEASCGDGVRSLEETCDDANVFGGDGCSAACRDEDAPLWSHAMDRGALLDEWFVDMVRAGDRYFVLHQGADAWQQWASTVAGYDTSGLLWETATGATQTGRFEALAVADGVLVLVGRRPGPDRWQAAIATRTLGGQAIGESLLADAEDLTAVVVAPNGDLFLGGTRRGTDPDLWFGRYDLAADTLPWSRSLPRFGSGEFVHDVSYREDLGLYYAGEVGNDAFIMRLDPQTGTTVWDVRVPPPDGGENALARAVTLTDAQVVVAGSKHNGLSEYGFDTDGWIAAFTPDGSLRWERSDAGPLAAGDAYLDVMAFEDGSVVAAGYRHVQALAVFVAGDIDGVLVEYDAEGTRLRELSYDGDVHLEDYFGALAMGEHGVVVAGQSTGTFTSEIGLLAEFELPVQAPSRLQRPPVDGELGDRPHPRALAATRSETLFVDFSGAEIRPGDDGRQGEIPCAEGPFEFPGLGADRAYLETVMARVALLLEPFDVDVVWEQRPPDALPYTTVLVGGEAAQLGVDALAAGFSCEIDCGNAHANELVFAFEEFSPEALANTIVHEAGHAWGLDHVFEQTAVMSPFAAGADAVVQDRCLDVSDETSTPTCLQEHAEFCPLGQQDAYAELIARLGERRVDVQAPRIEGLPAAQVEVDLGTPIPFDLTVEDDSASAGAELRVPDLGVHQVLDPQALAFEIFLPEGAWTVEIAAVDHAGNETVEALTVVVREAEGDAGSSSGGDEGSTGDEPDVPVDTDTDGGPGPDADALSADGCACTASGRPGGWGGSWVLLVAVGYGYRRRSRRLPLA